MIGVCSLLIVRCARDNCLIYSPIGTSAGGTMASYCSRDGVNPLRLGTILIVTGALAPGILLVPVGGAAAPSLGSILFQFRGAPPTITSCSLPIVTRARHNWDIYCSHRSAVPRNVGILFLPSYCRPAGRSIHL